MSDRALPEGVEVWTLHRRFHNRLPEISGPSLGRDPVEVLRVSDLPNIEVHWLSELNDLAARELAHLFTRLQEVEQRLGDQIADLAAKLSLEGERAEKAEAALAHLRTEIREEERNRRVGKIVEDRKALRDRLRVEVREELQAAFDQGAEEAHAAFRIARDRAEKAEATLERETEHHRENLAHIERLREQIDQARREGAEEERERIRGALEKNAKQLRYFRDRTTREQKAGWFFARGKAEGLLIGAETLECLLAALDTPAPSEPAQ